MSTPRIGDIIAGHREAFSALTEQLTLRNYVAGSADGYGDTSIDRSQHPDSPVTVDGVVTARRDFSTAEETGLQTDKTADIYVPDSAFITNGGESWNGTSVPFGTEVEDGDGTVYTVVEVTTPGHGWAECVGRAEEQ